MLRLLKESFLRSAPCQPPRSQEDVDFAYRTLQRLARERPDWENQIGGTLRSLECECLVEGLRFPVPARS